MIGAKPAVCAKWVNEWGGLKVAFCIRQPYAPNGNGWGGL